MNHPIETEIERAQLKDAAGGVSETLERGIANTLMRCANAADAEGKPELGMKLSMIAASLDLGEVTSLEKLTQWPDAPSEIARLPIKSIHELESDYAAFTKRADKISLHFRSWLPSLIKRPLVPGEAMVILADTGVGKTALAQCIARNASPLQVLMFQLELPNTLLFERYVQSAAGIDGDEVFAAYLNDAPPAWDSKRFSHIWTCDKSGITPAEIDELIGKARGKIGADPNVVIVDYIGLVKGGGKRYERISDAAEQLKVIAKNRNVVMIVLSQVSRPEDKQLLEEPRLHHAKDSGSIESSGGLVIGLWRDPDDNEKLWVKVLKNTKGRAGGKFACRFDFKAMTIAEVNERTETKREWVQ